MADQSFNTTVATIGVDRRSEDAALSISKWIEQRYFKVFGYCKVCHAPQFHKDISKFGICRACHMDHDIDEMDHEACGGSPNKSFHHARKMRWM